MDNIWCILECHCDEIFNEISTFFIWKYFIEVGKYNLFEWSEISGTDNYFAGRLQHNFRGL